MTIQLPVSKEYFIKRFTDLILKSGLAGFPKEDIDQQILLKSIVLVIGSAPAFTEKEINEKIQFWILQVSQLKMVDHSTLRRWLVDAGYLTRNKDGSAYQVVPSAPRPGFFDAEIELINVVQALEDARQEISRRKSEFKEKSKRG